MPALNYYKVSNFLDQMVDQNLVLGITQGSTMPSVLVTEEQRRSMALWDLKRDSTAAYVSMSPVRFSNAKEMRELLNGPKKKTPQWWNNLTSMKHTWAAFEHSRALHALFLGLDPNMFGVDLRWSRARFFTFAFNFARIPSRPGLIADLAYSEFSREFRNERPHRIHTTRYVLRRSLSAPVEEGDPTDVQRLISGEEVSEKMNNFLSQSSADSPFILFTYDYQAARGILDTNPNGAMFENGLEPFLYPQRRRRDDRDRAAHAAGPRRPPHRPRRLSRMPHVYFVDVKDMVQQANKHYNESPSLRKDAVQFGLKGIDIKNSNASIDSRTLMELWCQMAGGKYMTLQRQERAAEVMLNAMQPDGPSSSAGPDQKEAVESEDPNDLTYAPAKELEQEGEAPYEPYDFSDDEDLIDNYY